MLLKAVHRAFAAAHGAVGNAGAAILGIVRIEDFFIAAGVGHAHLVAFPQYRVEVADDHDHLALGVAPQESDDALLVVVRHDPLEALPAVVDLPHGGGLAVEGVEVLDIGLQLAVLVIAEQHPVQRFVFVPFNELAELLAHEQQLFAGVRGHVAIEGAQVGELLFVVAGHLVDQAALAVHDLVVADGQHKVFAESVEEAERDLAVVARAEERVGLHVAEHVVHPAHVPLEVEAETAVGRRFCHQRPGSGFLRDHHLVRVTAEHRRVALLQEGDGLQVFLAAVDVLLPFAVAAVVVEVKHAGHSVDAQAVDVVLLNPEQRAGDQEALHLRHAVVEHHRAPLFMLAAAGVGVLIAGRAVKHVQAVAVLGEVGGHPVQNDADAGLVELVHKSHKVMRRAVAAGGGKVTGDLVAPAAVKRILGDGQKLHMGIAHLLDVRDQLVGQLGVVVGHALLLHLPAACVQLVDEHRAVEDVALFLRFVPRGVAPGVAADVVDLAAVGRAGLGVEGVRVRLVDLLARRRCDTEFIDVVGFHAGDEQLPHSVRDLVHHVGVRGPAVKVPHHRHGLRVRRPDAEHHARLAVLRAQMRAEIAVRLHVVALFEQVDRQIGRVRRLCLFVLHQIDLPLQKRDCLDRTDLPRQGKMPVPRTGRGGNWFSIDTILPVSRWNFKGFL